MGAIDQHVPRLDVRVHYAGGVERVQRYQEVAEEELHLPLAQVIVLLLSIGIVAILSPPINAIIIIPADGCGAALGRQTMPGCTVGPDVSIDVRNQVTKIRLSKIKALP